MGSIITLQSGAAAFLKHNGHYLLMERAPGRKIAPGVWSGVGGHIEPYEINDPFSSCLREIYEETGITREHIFNLKLRYIIIRRWKDTIRQNYIYFGETDTLEFKDSDEGTLYWIPESALFNREYTKTFDAMLRHYTNTPDKLGRVVVGVAENDDGRLRMTWSAVEDFK